ncbi:hypothetical protein L6164_028368 [Bauhinia variegata]|uniref:Uncharacterized protein n=1 Tax=Bauhinia variegata TaxID=167791 RepID=A0ACB9LWX5_BAUVA|nr:hypothetical protein L6164_028368 [Bauhinia variegata]
MCRSTRHPYHPPNGLEIKSFLVRLSDFDAPKPFPELLTLLFLPRIKENALEIDGFKIQPGSPAIVSLHRFVAAQPHRLVYGSRQRVRVRASQGMRFQVYLSKAMLLEGILRKDHNHQCKLECELRVDVGHGVDPRVSDADAEVCIAVEGEAAIAERVPTVAKRKRDRKPFKFNEWELEDIPEEREVSYSSECCNNNIEIDIDDAVTDADSVCCPCSRDYDSDDSISNSNYPKQDYEGGLDIEGVRWAVDLGIWVMCLGLGYLVSKASIKSIGFARRPRMF